MLFFKKKRCEHEWVDLEINSPVLGCNTEIYCPKCNTSRIVSQEEAKASVRRSKLRKEYLEKERSLKYDRLKYDRLKYDR